MILALDWLQFKSLTSKHRAAEPICYFLLRTRWFVSILMLQLFLHKQKHLNFPWLFSAWLKAQASCALLFCCSFLCKTYSCQLTIQLSPKETDMTQSTHMAVKKLTSTSEFENNTAKSKEYFIRGFGNTQMETKIYNWIQRVIDVVLSWQLLSSIAVGLSHCQLGT